MKRFLLLWGVRAVVVVFCFLIPFAAQAQEPSTVTVASAVICQQIVNREAVDAGTSFAVSAGKLYCLSKIADIQDSTQIVHVWYYGDTERARVTLNVNPPSWRTYSSKIIQPHEIGAWRVEIQDSSGNVLETVPFETTP